LAKQNEGSIPNFQKTAIELLATRPDVASLELQPGGIISDVYPRGGYERAIGFSALKDPARRLAVNLALQKRIVTVAGPVRLFGGEPGIALMAPVFQRGRDGREAFWGFVAATVRLTESLGRAGLNELAAKGYDYMFFAPASPTQNATILAESGSVSLSRAFVQTIPARNTEFRLALQPHRGWIKRGELVLEIVVVLLIGGLLGAVVITAGSQRRLQTSLASTHDSLARESAGREQAQAELQQTQEAVVAAKAATDRAQTALQESQAASRSLEAQLTSALEAAQTSSKEAEARITDLQLRLEEAGKSAQTAAQTHQAALEKARQLDAAVQQLQAANRDLRDRLEATTHGALEVTEAARQSVEQAEGKIADLKAQLEESARTQKDARVESTRRMQELLKQNQQLHARIESLTRTALELRETERADLKEAALRISGLRAQLERVLEAAREASRNREKQAAPPQEQHAAPQVEPDLPTAATETEDPSEVPEQPSDPALPTPDTGRLRKTSARPKLPHDPQMDLWQPPISVPELGAAPGPTAPGADDPSHQAEATFNGSASDLTSSSGWKAELQTDPESQDEIEAPARVVADLPKPPIPPLPLPHQEEVGPRPKDHKSVPARAPTASAHPDFRKMVNQILPLLVDQDPGAKDCLKDNRAIFRSGFAPEQFAEFEQAVKLSAFSAALEHLKRAAKRQGFSV
jgi:hypothetical protein